MLKAVFRKWLGYAMVVTIMLQCSPLIGSMMTGMLSRFTTLADSIVCYDGGSIQVDGQGAEDLLGDLAAQSDSFTSVLEHMAKDALGETFSAGEHGDLNDLLNQLNENGLSALLGFSGCN